MKLYLVRHARVESGYVGCYNGHIDINASQDGLLEAKSNYEKLGTISFDALFCSTLQRARQTIELFDVKQDILYSDALREKSWGRHEGKTYDEVAEMECQAYENFEQWLSVLDGESVETFRQRVSSFFHTLCKQSFENVLVVTHAGVIYTLIHLLKGCSLEEAFGEQISYGEIYELDFCVENLSV